MAQRSAPFVSWGLSMPAPERVEWEVLDYGPPSFKSALECSRCEAYTPLLFFRRSAGAWLCRGCAQSPSTRPLGSRYE